MNRIKLFLELLLKREIITKSLTVSAVIGFLFFLLSYVTYKTELNYTLLFIFSVLIPYTVTTIFFTKSKTSFKSGELSVFNANLQCKICLKEINVNESEIIPYCPKCGNNNKWHFQSKSNSGTNKFERELNSISMFTSLNPSPMIRFAKNGEIVLSNIASTNMFGEDIIGLDIRLLLTSLHNIDLYKIIEESKQISFTESINNSFYHFDLIGIKNLNTCQIYGTNITELNNTKHLSYIFAKVIDNMSNIVFITDSNTNIEYVNKAFETQTDIELSSIDGKSIINVFDNEYKSLIEKLYSQKHNLEKQENLVKIKTASDKSLECNFLSYRVIKGNLSSLIFIQIS